MTGPFLIWLLLAFFYAYQYLVRLIPAVGSSYLLQDLNSSQFGIFCGSFHLGYTIASIPLSLLLDRFSIKKIIPLTLLLTSLGLMPLILGYPNLAILGRFISGLGAVGAILGLFKVISLYFKEAASKMLGVAFTIGLIGAISGGLPLAALINFLGFKKALFFLFSLGFIMSLALYFIIPDTKSELESFSIKALITDLKFIITNKRLVLLAIAGGLMIGTLEGFTDGWSVKTFEIIHHWSGQDSSLVPSVIFFGMCLGSSFLGYLTQKTGQHYTIMAGAGFLMLGLFYFILNPFLGNQISLLLLLFLLGNCCAYKVVVLSKSTALADPKLVTTSGAFVNMILMTSGALYHGLIGSRIANYSRDLNPQALAQGILIVVIGLVLGLTLIFYLKKEEKLNSPLNRTT
jgi:MFS family permease